MDGSINSDEGAASDFSQGIQQSLSDYTDTSNSFVKISDVNDVQGSTTHDVLKGGIDQALSAWKDLIVADAQAIESVAAAFNDTDGSIAQGLMGVGGVG